MRHLMIHAAAVLLSSGVAAQTLSGIQLEPATAKVGEAVRITGRFDKAENPNCHVRLHFGDGQTQDFKLNQAKDVPLVVARSYSAPGQYKVMVEPKTALPMMKCVGSNQTALLTVTAAAPAALASPAGARAAPGTAQCPGGWKLDAKSVNKRSGAYTCTAKIGAPLPATKPECPSPLGYFENRFKGQLGCRA